MSDWRSMRVTATSEVVTAKDRPVGPAVRLLRLVWRVLPEIERRRFVNALDDNLLFQSVKSKPVRESSDRDLMEIIRNWNAVLPSLDGDSLKFAISIKSNIKKSADWWPSDKQAGFMRSLWKDRLIVEGELEVTE